MTKNQFQRMAWPQDYFVENHITKNMAYDTSPYAFMGYIDDPYNAFSGGMCVQHFNNWSVEDFTGVDGGTFTPEADSLFGRNKQKKGERKLRKAEKQLAKGHVKKAERKLGKAQKILGTISKDQAAILAAQQQLGQVQDTQGQIAVGSGGGAIGGMSTSANLPQSMAAAPMSEMGSSMGAANGAGGGGMGTGVESSAPDTSANDEPTGALADVKTLGNVTVKAHKGISPIILIAIAVLALFAIVYFSKKKGRRK